MYKILLNANAMHNLFDCHTPQDTLATHIPVLTEFSPEDKPMGFLDAFFGLKQFYLLLHQLITFLSTFLLTVQNASCGWYLLIHP